MQEAAKAANATEAEEVPLPDLKDSDATPEEPEYDDDDTLISEEEEDNFPVSHSTTA